MCRISRCVAVSAGRREGRGRVAGVRLLRAGPGEHARGRVGRLGAGGGTVRQRLEVVLCGRVVRPEPEQPGDGLGTEPARRREPGGARSGLEARRDVRETRGADEACVERRDRDRRGARGREHGLSREPADERAEVLGGERIVGPERGDIWCEQPVADHGDDLRLSPRARRRGRVERSGHDGESAEREDDGSAAHPGSHRPSPGGSLVLAAWS